MREYRFLAACGCVLTASLALSLGAAADDYGLTGGAYDVTYRLEVPHVERFAVDFRRQICLPETAMGRPVALQVLSANTPFATCPVADLILSDGTLRYEIICPGRAYQAARAKAVFAIAHNRFSGRIHMIMGGKNMTFVEVQSGRRVGDCPDFVLR